MGLFGNHRPSIKQVQLKCYVFDERFQISDVFWSEDRAFLEHCCGILNVQRLWVDIVELVSTEVICVRLYFVGGMMRLRGIDDIEYFSLSNPFLVFSYLFMFVIAFLEEDC